MVRSSDIVGIFDMDTSTVSKHTRNFLAGEEKKGNVINVSQELPKSFTLTSKNKKTNVYISQISSGTLNKRNEYMDIISNV